jgi:hypothetical protein
MSVIDGPLLYFDYGDLDALRAIGWRREEKRSDFYTRREEQAELVRALGADCFKPPPANPAPAKPRRQRKPNICKMIAEAERGGKTVTSITTPDGITLHFGKGEATEASNPWPLDDFKVTKQ